MSALAPLGNFPKLAPDMLQRFKDLSTSPFFFDICATLSKQNQRSLLGGRELRALLGVSTFPWTGAPIPDDLNIWSDATPSPALCEEYFKSLPAIHQATIIALETETVLNTLQGQRAMLETSTAVTPITVVQSKFQTKHPTSPLESRRLEARFTRMATAALSISSTELAYTPAYQPDGEPWSHLECQFLFNPALGLTQRIRAVAAELKRRPDCQQLFTKWDDIVWRRQIVITQDKVEEALASRVANKRDVKEYAADFDWACNLIGKYPADEMRRCYEEMKDEVKHFDVFKLVLTLFAPLADSSRPPSSSGSQPINWAELIDGYADMDPRKKRQVKKKARAKLQKANNQQDKDRVLLHVIAAAAQDTLIGLIQQDRSRLREKLLAVEKNLWHNLERMQSKSGST
ncbi:hypothetical protein J8273_1049 [Carpediemonas membranifera]|uniref:Uncharacterized protein n=1 Tax=Carpediemonas membranifera TaxID=201153 RepID=A0A8J6B2R7_9EUKA|nr:hypothetical protein J8273_1049 [Carpediemonas membranifera]|eukprot:KAG9397140.1 hypothetical protein J8273_1049 [Carpediemonas membranifera]